MKRWLNGWRVLPLLAALAAGIVPRSALAANYRAALAHGVASRDRAEETGNPEDWQEALDAFEEASGLEATKEAKFELANASLHLGLDDEACAAFAEALSLGLAGKAEEIARAFIDAHQTLLARLDISGPAGTVVHVGARKRAVLPLAAPLLVLAGAAHVRLEAPDCEPWQGDLSVQAGESKIVQPTFVCSPPTAVHSPPAQPVAEAAAPMPMPAPTPPRHRLASGSKWGAPALVAGGVLAGLGAATIVATSVVLSNERKTLSQSCAVFQGGQCVAATAEQRAAAQTAANHIQTNQTLRWVAVGGALVGLGAAAVGLVRTISTQKESSAPHADLQLSPQSCSLEIRARF